MNAAHAPLFNETAKGPANGRAFWRDASDGVRIRLGHWPHADDTKPAGTVFLFPGRTEYIEKYGVIASELAELGFDTLTIDWRGQGLADRPDLARELGHVGDFDEYQRDCDQMVQLAAELDLPKPYVLLGHSMGGCIGLRALHNGLDVTGAVFSAPMWGITIASALRPVAWGLSWALHASPWKQMLAPGTSRTTYVAMQPFEDNMLTTDRAMYELMQDQAKAHPELTLAGPTAGWLYAALSETHQLARKAAPQKPCVTFLGTNERIVESPPIKNLMARWPNGRLEMAQGCEHEVVMEARSWRDKVYRAVQEMAES